MVRFVLPSPYEPVDSANGQIRLLVLYPPDNSYKQANTIRCDLKPVFLSSKPQYEALSYTWGTLGQNPDEIRLGSQQFEVRENVAAALRRLRHPKKPRTLWVDAICINQDDLAERAAQVLLMRQIYSQASQVCVWLGELGDAGIVGMQMLQKKVLGTTWSKFKIDRDWGRPMSWGRKVLKQSTALVEKGGNLEDEFTMGEVRELLSRPWWRRTWVIQEVVVASKIMLMCGDETVPWESIEKFHQYETKSRMTGLTQAFGHLIDEKHMYLVEGYQAICDCREKWLASPSEVNILDLLYRFRNLDCEDPRDRIFAFLGIAPAAVDMGILPDYESSATEVYSQFARKVIAATGVLDILNRRREWRDVGATPDPGHSYSLLDQSRYYDPDAEITDGPDRKTRRGWARLPEGWERIPQGKASAFFDHKTGMIHDKSPLEGQPPVAAEYYTKYRTLSPGWARTWNDVGCPQVQYRPKDTEDDKALQVQRERQQAGLSKLPSWVPNWATPTPWDPAPFVDLTRPDKQRFFASGATRCKLSLSASSESLSPTITLSGYLLDTIVQIAPAWHPPNDTIPPVSANGIEALQAWESLATAPVLFLDLENTNQSDPYTQTSHADLTTSPRYEAFLHTLIASPPSQSPSTAPENQPPASLETLETLLLVKTFLTWSPPKPPSQMPKAENGTPNVYEAKFFEHLKALSATVVGHLLKTDDEQTRFFELARVSKSYGQILSRVLKTCAHRRLFVTRDGYLGLAGWDAKVGDQVVVLEGGRTPFLVRERRGKESEVNTDGKVDGKDGDGKNGDVEQGGLKETNGEHRKDDEQWQFVGETYVYGVMGGEVLNMGLERKEFRIL